MNAEQLDSLGTSTPVAPKVVDERAPTRLVCNDQPGGRPVRCPASSGPDLSSPSAFGDPD
jgi:hypothetical protein